MPLFKFFKNAAKPEGKNTNGSVILPHTLDILEYLIWVFILSEYRYKYRFFVTKLESFCKHSLVSCFS